MTYYRRGFPRTPEGAWYQGYVGLKPRFYSIHNGYAEPPPFASSRLPEGEEMDMFGFRTTSRDSFNRDVLGFNGYNNSDYKNKNQNPNAFHYEHDKNPHSYRSYPEGRERLSRENHGSRRRDENGAYKNDGMRAMEFPLYDPKSFSVRNGNDANFKSPRNGGGGGGGGGEGNYYHPSPRHSPADFKYYDPPPRNGPREDFKSYEANLLHPPARQSPVDFKHQDPPPRNGLLADFKMYDGPPPAPHHLSPRHSPMDSKVHDFPPAPRNGPSPGPDFKKHGPSLLHRSNHNGGILADVHGYGSSPRGDGLSMDGGGRRHDISRYHPSEKRERDLVPASPRRMGPYEPSFHDHPPGHHSPGRNMLPPPPPQMYPDKGHGHLEDQGHGSEAGSALLFIRFHGDSLRIIEQACQAAITKDLKGRFVGIAEKVWDFPEIPEKRNTGIAVFQFPSLKHAEIFFNRDRRFRLNSFPQPYWDTEIFALHLQKDPSSDLNSLRTFVLSEVTVTRGLGEESLREYQRDYAEPFSGLLQDQGALPFAAFCSRDDRRLLKKCYFDRHDIVLLHLFRDPQHYHDVWSLKRYAELREKHDSLATERCSVFTVRSQFYP